MANVYESKFKGVEIDDGVNTATYATGTGGINVTIKGTTNVTGTGGRHLEIDGSGKQDKLTVSSNVHINSLTIATSSAGGLYFTNETGAGISYRILVAASSGTAPLARLTVPNDIAGETQTIATREYVNAHSSSYNPGSGINISGNTISLDKRIMVDNITLGNYSSGNVILLPQSGASGNVYFPKYGGTLATTNEVPAVVQIMGTGTTTVMSQKAVTEALTGKQDKLTMGAGLSMTGNVIYCNGSLTGVTLDVNNIKISGQLDMSGTMVRGGLTYDFPTKGGTFALTSDIPTGGGGGNINLYRHTVKITQGTTGSQNMIYTTLYSSNNTPIGSLADLKTMLNLSASETYPAYGTVSSGQAVLYLQKVGANLTVNYMTGSMTSQTLSSGRVDDWVKTI